MSNDAERSGIGRLWSGGGTREKVQRPEPERTKDNVLPLHPDDRSYKAFETREHPADLHIRCATQPSHFPAYSSLLNIIFDHDFDRAFTLVYTFMLVEVTGKDLGAVVHAISYRNCERITEFHRKLHDQPEPNEPIIEGIKITAAIGGSQRAST
jgi:hypothetical protein